VFIISVVLTFVNSVWQRSWTSTASYGYTAALLMDPLAVVIVTPIMQRAHALDEASRSAFVYSASGCDDDDHTLTLVLTPCAAGAVPLGAVITANHRDRTMAFNLLNAVTERYSFAGRGHPSTFVITGEDAETEVEAVREVWTDSDVRLSLVDVQRSAWSWLWNDENGVAVEDRKPLLESFQRVLQP
jgi:hypothetical protein